MRTIREECFSSGGGITTSLEERTRGWVRCESCGRILKLRGGTAGLVVDRPEHILPKHSRLAPKKRRP